MPQLFLTMCLHTCSFSPLNMVLIKIAQQMLSKQYFCTSLGKIFLVCYNFLFINTCFSSATVLYQPRCILTNISPDFFHAKNRYFILHINALKFQFQVFYTVLKALKKYEFWFLNYPRFGFWIQINSQKQTFNTI